MFSLIKFCFFVAVTAIVVLVVTGHKIGDKTIQEHYKIFMGKKAVKEGVKDLRVLVGEAIKTVGSELADEVTEEEKADLDNLVREELKGGKSKSNSYKQEALPPVKNN